MVSLTITTIIRKKIKKNKTYRFVVKQKNKKRKINKNKKIVKRKYFVLLCDHKKKLQRIETKCKNTKEENKKYHY